MGPRPRLPEFLTLWDRISPSWLSHRPLSSAPVLCLLSAERRVPGWLCAGRAAPVPGMRPPCPAPAWQPLASGSFCSGWHQRRRTPCTEAGSPVPVGRGCQRL